MHRGPALLGAIEDCHLNAMHDTGAPALSDTSTLGSDLPYGPGRAALDLAVRCLDEAEKEQQPAAMCEALAGIARCYRALSAYAHAMDFMRQALRWCERRQRSGQAQQRARRTDGIQGHGNLRVRKRRDCDRASAAGPLQ